MLVINAYYIFKKFHDVLNHTNRDAQFTDSKIKIFAILFSCKQLNLVILERNLYL